MRMIVLSTDVFAAIWATRQTGEDSENAILERLLGLPKGPPVAIYSEQMRAGRSARHGDGQGGIYNRMFDVRFASGFEIFRTYKGRDYSAMVRDGRWVMNGESFPSLFALSMAIVDSRENPWMHWKYRDAEGAARLIRDLRKITPEFENYLRQDAKPEAGGAKRSPKKNGRKPGR